MAVAVKTSPGARTPEKPGGLATLSLLGVVYLVATLAIVFKLLPSLWWSAWEGMGFGQAAFVGAALLAVVEVAAVIALVWCGAKLLGANPPVGVRAGVFVGFVGLLAILLLTRWAGVWFEDMVFVKHSLTTQMGAIFTGVTGGVLLAAALYGFTRPWTLEQIVKFEEAGWFHATSYKANQGRLVRRATIVGILVLAGTGIWTLTTGRLLSRGPADWALSIPFTGMVSVEKMGDAREFVRDEVPASAKPEVQIKWPGNERDTNVHADQVVSVEAYKKLVTAALNSARTTAGIRQEKVQEEIKAIEAKDKAAQDGIKLAKLKQENQRWAAQRDSLAVAQARIDKAADKDVVEYIREVNQTVHDGYKSVVASSGFHEDITRRLTEMDRDTGWDDLSKLLAALKKETADLARGADSARRVDELGWTVALPLAIPVVDRSALVTANEKTKKSAYVKVGVNRNPNFKLPEGKVVSTADYDKEEVRVYLDVARGKLDADTPKGKAALARLAEAEKGEGFNTTLDDMIQEEPNVQLKTQLEAVRNAIKSADDVTDKSIPLLVPRRELLTPATGSVLYASVPLLPAVQFTLPLVLLAGAIWLAWRTVNLPVFADFLIATEAEMNKVSWTTQKRLVQDTIVVLVTVVVMAVFLFSMDVMWKQVLSWKHIGVLHVPEDRSEKKKRDEDKW